MNSFVHDNCLFVSLNPAEHVAVTLPGSLLDLINKAGGGTEDQFLFFANKEGSLLRIRQEEYEIMKKFPPQSPFDEELKKIVCGHFLLNTKK